MIVCGEYGVKQPNNTYVCVMFCGVVSYVSFRVACVYCGICVWCGEVWCGMCVVWRGVMVCVRFGVVYVYCGICVWCGEVWCGMCVVWRGVMVCVVW